MVQHTRPSATTREEEAREAKKAHDAGPEPDADEAAAADKNSVDPKTRAAYEAMIERGAKQKGEGRPEP